MRIRFDLPSLCLILFVELTTHLELVSLMSQDYRYQSNLSLKIVLTKSWNGEEAECNFLCVHIL